MKNKLSWLEAALVLAPFVAIAVLWNQIPTRVPMHWNIHGEVDRWSSTRAEVLILPLIGLGMVALLHVFAQARSETAEDASEKRSHEFRVAGPLRRFRGLV